MKHTIEKTSHEFSFDKNATIINNTACIYPNNSNHNFLFFVLSACIAIKRAKIVGIYCIKPPIYYSPYLLQKPQKQDYK